MPDLGNRCLVEVADGKLGEEFARYNIGVGKHVQSRAKCETPGLVLSGSVASQNELAQLIRTERGVVPQLHLPARAIDACQLRPQFGEPARVEPELERVPARVP